MSNKGEKILKPGIYLPVFLSLAAGCLLQVFFGDMPSGFFSFPVNLIIAALWIFGMFHLVRDRKTSAVTAALTSGQMTILVLVLFAAGAVITGLFTQMSPEKAASMEGFAGRMGFYNFTGTWTFAVILFWFLTNLGMITLRRFRSSKGMRWRFFLNHAGLWIALFAGFVGNADETTLSIPVFRDTPNHTAYDRNSRPVLLDKEFTLQDFSMDHYENGAPKHYTATVSCGDETFSLEVNRPYSAGFGEDIYLSGYDTENGTPRYCTLLIVKQPYRWLMLMGIVMTLAGAVLMFTGGVKEKAKKANGKKAD